MSVANALGKLAAEQMEAIDAAADGDEGWEIGEAVFIVQMRHADGREGHIRIRTLTQNRPLAIGLVDTARHELLGKTENLP